MRLHITDTSLNRLRSTQGLHRDSKLIGFGVRISSVTSFIVESKHNGHTKRITLGRYPVMSVQEARNRAMSILKEIRTGIKAMPMLKDAYSDYLAKVSHKPSTERDYLSIYVHYLKEWGDKPINTISRDMIITKYEHDCIRSVAQANKVMRYLSAVLNYCEIENNPIKVLTQRRLRVTSKPKTSYLPTSDLKLFYRGLNDVKNSSVRLYIELLLHTGLRANEALQINADSVKTGYLVIPDTKNGSTHTLPLSRWFKANLLPYLDDCTEGFTVKNISKSLITACQYLDYTITRHDLRRTFASYASEAGCDYLLIKRALNHSVSDITARYIQTSPKTLAPVFDSVAELISEHK